MLKVKTIFEDIVNHMSIINTIFKLLVNSAFQHDHALDIISKVL